MLTLLLWQENHPTVGAFPQHRSGGKARRTKNVERVEVSGFDPKITGPRCFTEYIE
ncbi:MAG: hypothetical protein V1778_02400 [bacterium]